VVTRRAVKISLEALIVLPGINQYKNVPKYKIHDVVAKISRAVLGATGCRNTTRIVESGRSTFIY
jgi:hypothetical protein